MSIKGDLNYQNLITTTENYFSIYKIVIKKILEYKHSNFMKPYIDFLFEKKSCYKKNGDIGMSNTFKILANSLFGVMMTRCEKFKDFKIVTTESQVDKQIKKPNFSCRNIINENLTILEMEKNICYIYLPCFNRGYYFAK